MPTLGENPFLRSPIPDSFRMTPEDYLALDKAPRRPNQPATRFDYRGAENGRRRLKLSEFGPGDLLLTDGADIQIQENGAPRVHLKSGYGNGRSAAAEGPMLEPTAPRGVSVAENTEISPHRSPFWFKKAVQNRGPWDYKQRGPQYEAFGNFNYGATGRAARIPSPFLFQEAGRAQARDTNTDPEFGAPGPRFLPFLGKGSYGDDPIDQYWIEQGVRHHDQRRR